MTPVLNIGYKGITKFITTDNLLNLIRQAYPSAYLKDNNIVIPKPSNWDDNDSLELRIQVSRSTSA